MQIKKNNDTALVADYTYDGLGRRIEKVDAVAGKTTRYYYDEQRVLLETDYDTSETDLRYYLWGNYIDELLVMRKLTETAADYYYAHDHLYSTVALFDSSGAVVERYEYDAYGSVRMMDASYNARTSSSYNNPYFFTGRELDRLDNGNLKLQYNRNRYLDNVTGRWLTRDPFRYADSINLYEYVSSRATSALDPMGLYDSFIHKTMTTKLAMLAGICLPRTLGDHANRPDRDDREPTAAYLEYLAALSVLGSVGQRCDGLGSCDMQALRQAQEMVCQAWEKVKRAGDWHFPQDPDGRVKGGSPAARSKADEGIARCDFKAFGEGLHVFQDSWSHSGIPSLGEVGHDTDTWWLPDCLDASADKPGNDIEKTKDMAEETYRLMTNFLDKCSCHRCGPSKKEEAQAYIDGYIHSLKPPVGDGWDPPIGGGTFR